MKIMLFLCVYAVVAFTGYGAGASDKAAFTISTSYKSLLSNPEQTGMLDRLMKEVFRRIGLRAEIVFSPTGRSLANVNAGLLDSEINRIEGMEEHFPNLVRVPEPNMTMHFVAFAKQHYPIDGWESIENLHIGIIRGWKILEKNTKGFQHVTLVPTEIELFNMLHKGRVDVVLYDKLTGYEQLNIRGCTDIRHLEPPLASRDMFLYLNKKHADLVESVANALKAMKEDGTYDRIVREATSHIKLN